MRTKIFSLSLPPELLQQVERIAKKEGRTKSELFREALRRYIQEKEWRELQRYGYQKAKRLSFQETDVERIIDGYRKGK